MVECPLAALAHAALEAPGLRSAAASDVADWWSRARPPRSRSQSATSHLPSRDRRPAPAVTSRAENRV